MSYEPILDISRYQYPVNFETMYSRGVRLLFLRLTVGDYYKDTRFDEFYAAARSQGMYVGCYHVVKPSISPQAQFDKIIASLPFALLDVPLVLDCELTDGKTPAQITSNIVSLISLCYQTFGKYPIIYTRGEWWNTNTVTNPLFTLCPLWIARYTTLPHPWNDAPSLRPRDWLEWDIWQHSADGNLKGAYYGVGSLSVDENRSAYDTVVNTVIALNGGQPVPPPDPIGEPHMQFINTGGDISNIRSAPVISATNIIGKLPDGAKFIALEIDFTAGYAWAKYAVDPAWLLPGKTGATGWSALILTSGNPLIDFYAAVPCPEGEPIPMTPAQLQRLENVEAEIIVLKNTPPGEVFIPTHKLVTTKTGGEKLRAYPNGSEAVQVYNGAILMELKQERGGQVLMGYEKEGVIITGFIDPLLLVEL